MSNKTKTSKTFKLVSLDNLEKNPNAYSKKTRIWILVGTGLIALGLMIAAILIVQLL